MPLNPAHAHHQRHVNRVLSVEQRLEIQALCGRLRKRSREIRDDPKFVPPIGVARIPFALSLGELAGTIDRRRKLGLSLDWWMVRAHQWLGET